MPSKFTSLTEASLSQALVLFISGRRVPVSGLSAHTTIFSLSESVLCSYSDHSRLVHHDFAWSTPKPISLQDILVSSCGSLASSSSTLTAKSPACEMKHHKLLRVHPVVQFLQFGSRASDRRLRCSKCFLATLPVATLYWIFQHCQSVD